jgi:hypothetical protein
VRGRPGAFVRASQDLNQATLDRSRLEQYVAALNALEAADPTQLKTAAPLLARSLAIKVDEKCLDRTPDLQVACLTQGQNALILNDGHSASIVEALTSGPVSNLAMEASYTPQLSYGYYSPYLASVLDIARIFDSFRVADYQYIPALAAPRGGEVALMLNAPPSFHTPLSVLVAALPAVEAARLPPLHAVNPGEVYCAKKTPLVLPVEGAPLVFAAGYAHDLRLAVVTPDGQRVELPARADARQGGVVVDTAALNLATPAAALRGALLGYWGFDRYDGPEFDLEDAHAVSWQLAPGDASGVVVGREETIHLQGRAVSCVQDVSLQDAHGKTGRTAWRAVGPNEIELRLPLQDTPPGSMTLRIEQYGVSDARSIPLEAFAEAAHFDGFTLYAGDTQGVLTGNRLDQVTSLTLRGSESPAQFLPDTLRSAQGTDQLSLTVQDPQRLVQLRPGESVKGLVALRDGRTMDLRVTPLPPRPRTLLMARAGQMPAAARPSHVNLASDDELPQGATLTFSVRAVIPAVFSADDRIEVATADRGYATFLSTSDGGITLADDQVAVAKIDPARALGVGAFGPLQYRVVTRAASSDWQPLVTLVRVPTLEDLECPPTPDRACRLTGTDLFLLQAVSNDPQFSHAVPIPDGFPGHSLPVPHPSDGQLYLRLRDDSGVINSATLMVRPSAVLPEPAPGPTAASASVDSDPAPPPAAATDSRR